MDIINYADSENIEAVILSIDFEKTFNRVKISCLVGSLKIFNFGENLIRWTPLLYKNFESCTLNSGFISQLFHSTRGLHQGCPAWASYFILVAEIWGVQLCSNPKIQGISILHTAFTLSQYADDMVVFSICTHTSLNAIVDTLSNFERASGLKINYEKSDVYRIGSIKNSDVKIEPRKNINRTSGPIHVLGVDIYDNEQQVIEMNYMNTVSMAENTGFMARV